MKNKVWLKKSDMFQQRQHNYAVFISRGSEADLCILPFTNRADADIIKDAFIKVGYLYKGVL